MIETASTAFRAWPKIPRLNRDIVITEKIDGTNAHIFIEPAGGVPLGAITCGPKPLARVDGFFVFAGKRSGYCYPDKDNYGFAAWVLDNAPALVALGPGRHYGEWWGHGIQRGYGLQEKRFSLFCVPEGGLAPTVPVSVVPVLFNGPFSERAVSDSVNRLRRYGSLAAAGYMKPEGVVVYHTAARSRFKVTLGNDEKPKGAEC